MNDKNKNLFKLSQKFIPGGVNSPVRAFSSVGGTPIFFKKAWEVSFGMKMIKNILTILTHGAQ